MSTEGLGGFGLPSKAEKTLTEQGPRITHPIARTNMDLPTGTSPRDRHFTKLGKAEGDNRAPQTWILKELHQTGARLPVDMSHEPSVRLTQELSVCQRLADPETGQKFGVITANWDNFTPDQTVTVAYSLYGNVATNKDGTTMDNEVLHRHREMARQVKLPTGEPAPFITFEYPSVGASDRIRRDQLPTHPDTSFFAIADAQLRIMKQLGIKKINVTGQSMGGFAAATVAERAAQHGIFVEHIELNEPAGVETMPARELMMRDMAEFGNLDLYSTFPFDPKMYTASDSDKTRSFWQNIKHQAKSLGNLVVRDPAFVYARMLSRGTIESRVSQALASQDTLRESLSSDIPPTKVIFNHGSESTVCPKQVVREIVHRLREVQVQGKPFGNRVMRHEFPGEGHLTAINAKRSAAHTNLFFAGAFDKQAEQTRVRAIVE